MQFTHDLHTSAFLSVACYLVYYLGMRTLPYRGASPKIGLNLCYGYSPKLLSILGLLHFILLTLTWYLLIYGPFLKSWSLLISIFLLTMNLFGFLILREFLVRIFIHKQGIFLLYFDGRTRYFYFEEIKRLNIYKSLIGKRYDLELLDGERAFLFHSTLIDSQELATFIRDRVLFFSQDSSSIENKNGDE
jgi:hypothetical protein